MKRSADKNDDRFATGIVTEGFEFTHAALLEGLGEEEVGTGIAGKAEFRKTDHLHAFRDRFVYLRANLLGVITAVRHLDCRHSGRNTYKSKIRFHSI